WVSRINNRQFVVSKKYADQLRLIVLTMQFDSVEKFASTGDKKRALQGYVEIYRNKLSPPESRKNAAYNITILFHELGHAPMTKRWAENTLNLDRKSTRLNSSHVKISYAVFCLKKKTKQ